MFKKTLEGFRNFFNNTIKKKTVNQDTVLYNSPSISFRIIEDKEELRQHYDHPYDWYKKSNYLSETKSPDGFPLCVPYPKKDIVKSCGAFWSPEHKAWHWPYEKDINPYYEQLQEFIPKIYNPSLSPPYILPNLVPEPLWGQNFRTFLQKEDWDFIRKETYKSSGNRCSTCGGKGEEWPVECNEVWDYRHLSSEEGVCILNRFEALCPKCHSIHHIGKARVDGRYRQTLSHMALINRTSLSEAEEKAMEAMELFEKNSDMNWTVGFENENEWTPEIERILFSLS
jgi:hypothetical protein